MGGLLCCSSGRSNDPAPVWPAHVHPGLINTALTQLLCSPGRLGNALGLCESRSKGPGGCWCRVKQSVAWTVRIKGQLWFIFHSVCKQWASSQHITVSSPLSVLRPTVEYQTFLYTSHSSWCVGPSKKDSGMFILDLFQYSWVLISLWKPRCWKDWYMTQSKSFAWQAVILGNK